MFILRFRIGAAALILSLLFGATLGRNYKKATDAVKLNRVKSLTFYAGKLTTSRRVEPIPQLQCTGGSAQGLFEPETIRCQYSGSSYSEGDVQWTCQASLPPEFKLGGTEVVCEGYDNSDDEFILKGSCGLEYRLILTEMGKEKFGKSWFRAADQAGPAMGKPSTRGSDFSPMIFWIVFLAVACWMAYAAFCRDPAPNRVGQRRRLDFQGRRGGGGIDRDDDDDNDDPPPPYDPRPPRPSYNPPKSKQPRSSYGGNIPAANQGRAPGWRPGFWTGLGTGMTAGAAARTLFNGARVRSNVQNPSRGSTTNFGHDPGEGSSTGRTRTSPSFGSSMTGSMGSSSQPYSNERYTSTGFGGTRKR